MLHYPDRLAALLCALLLILVIPASAHEGREVGAYSIVFGWRMEPAYTGLLNGPEFTITVAEEHEDDHHDEASTMVEGAEETLQLEVSFGDQTKVLRLRAVWGEPGAYTADLIPTMPGDYTFRLTGTINGTEVDEVFSSADGEFSTVEPVEDIQFP